MKSRTEQAAKTCRANSFITRSLCHGRSVYHTLFLVPKSQGCDIDAHTKKKVNLKNCPRSSVYRSPYIKYTRLTHTNMIQIPLYHIFSSQDGTRANAFVRIFTLSNINISATSRSIAIKFNLYQHWGGRKAALCFWSDRSRTLVSMSTDSSHRL